MFRIKLLILFCLINLINCIVYKIPNLEYSCKYVDLSKQHYICQNFDLSANHNDELQIDFEGYQAFTHAHIITFKNCQLPSMPTNYFRAFPRIVNMTITNCGLKGIGKNSIIPLPSSIYSILIINLSKNDLEDLPSGLFSNLIKLQSVNLAHNKIESFDMLFTSANKDIRVLDLSNNSLRTVHTSALSFLENLVHLDLSDNFISLTDKNLFLKNRKLETIKINNNHMMEVNESFRNLTKLTELHLFDNIIENINPKAFDNLIELKKLMLGRNIISRIDVNLFKNLINLEELNLSENMIETIKGEHFENLNKLKILKLYKNHIHNFDTSSYKLYDKLPSLMTFDISNNPQNFEAEEDYDDSMFHSPKENNNEVRNYLNIKLNILQFSNLTNFNLAYTNINKSLAFNSFWHFKSLESLDLSGNNLVKIDNHIFYPIEMLKEIKLNSNNLTQLDYVDAKIFKQPLRIDLTNNPWNCTYLSKMLKYFNKIDVEYLPSWNHVPKREHNLAGIGCVGEVNEEDQMIISDKAVEAKKDLNTNSLDGKYKRRKIDLDADEVYDVVQPQKFHSENLHIELTGAEGLQKALNRNLIFFGFVLVAIIGLIVSIAYWNSMQLKSGRMTKFRSQEGNLLSEFNENC